MGANERTTATQDEATTERVVALASALKFTTVYPPSHPRVVRGVEHFLSLLAAQARAFSLCLREETFVADGRILPVDHLSMKWLAQRLRAGGLRGFEVDCDSTVDDVLQLALALQRPNNTAATNDGEAPKCVRLLPLVFTGHHSELAPDAAADGAGGAAATGGEIEVERAAAQAAATEMDRVLLDLRDMESVRARISSIQSHSSGADDDESRQVDLIREISKMLPADIARDPEEIVKAVHTILESLEQNVVRLAQNRSGVKGAKALRQAMKLARTYFRSESPTVTTRSNLPSGRPEDGKIQADLGLLLAEHAALPDARLSLLSSGEIDPSAATLAREQLGILLYMMADPGHPFTAPLAAAMKKLLTPHAEECRDLLDGYLGPTVPQASMPVLRQLQLITMLGETGQGRLVRQQRYLSAERIARTYPQSLKAAAAVFGSDPLGWAIVRDGLASMGPTLKAVDIEAARLVEVLSDPGVLQGLALASGPHAHQLLHAAAVTEATPAVRKALLTYLRTLPLARPGVTVVKLVVNGEDVPADYLRGLFVAHAEGRMDKVSCVASARLLRRVLISAEPLSLDLRLQAIDDLGFDRGEDTVLLLRRFARERRFAFFDLQARAIRRHARKVLSQLQQGPRS